MDRPMDIDGTHRRPDQTTRTARIEGAFCRKLMLPSAGTECIDSAVILRCMMRIYGAHLYSACGLWLSWANIL